MLIDGVVDMVGALVKTDNDIKNIQSNSTILRHIRIRKLISKLKIDLYNELRYINVIDPKILVDFAELINTARLLKFCNDEQETISISCLTSSGKSKYPIVSLIEITNLSGIDMRGLNKITYKASIEADIDRVGNMEICFELDYDSKFNNKSITKTIKKSVRALSADVDKNITDRDKSLLVAAYFIIRNIISIYIELIISGIKERYLK